MSTTDSAPPSDPEAKEAPFLAAAIPLQTGSPIPIYLTQYYYTDIPTSYATITLEAISSVLITLPSPYTLSDAEFWINTQLSPTPSPLQQLPLQVIRAHHPDASGTMIGSVSLAPREPHVEGGEAEYEVGYWLHPDWRGKGIMGAAVRELVKWGKEAHGAKAFIRVEEGNLKSRKVVEGVREWERVKERDAMVDWPEAKGGGQRWVLFWRWKYE